MRQQLLSFRVFSQAGVGFWVGMKRMRRMSLGRGSAEREKPGERGCDKGRKKGEGMGPAQAEGGKTF